MSLQKNIVWVLLASIAILTQLTQEITQTFNDAPKKESSYIVCYVGTWAIYRPEPGKFDADNVDPHLCTHLIYAFAGINNETHTIMSLDPARDYDQGGFKNFTDLKTQNSNLKVTISVGGWNEGSAKFSAMASNKLSRETFINSVINFIREHNFDGLDIDWNYPGLISRGGAPEDKKNFNFLVDELRRAMPSDWALTMAIGAEADVLGRYDFPELTTKVDFFSVSSYDYHGNWETFTGYNAPLFYRPEEEIIERTLNVNFSIHRLITDAKLPRSKIVVGMAFYGRIFMLEDADFNTPESPTRVGEGFSGPFTNQPGFLAYNELCNMTEDSSWVHKWDQYQKVPYMIKNHTWISYDNPKSLFLKARYVLENKLAGVMIWAMDFDDFIPTCSQQKYPLLDAIMKGLGKRQMTPEFEQEVFEPSSAVVFHIFYVLLMTLICNLILK